MEPLPTEGIFLISVPVSVHNHHPTQKTGLPEKAPAAAEAERDYFGTEADFRLFQGSVKGASPCLSPPGLQRSQ